MALCDKVKIEERNAICTKKDCIYSLPEGKCSINYEKIESSGIAERLEVYENSQSAD